MRKIHVEVRFLAVLLISMVGFYMLGAAYSPSSTEQNAEQIDFVEESIARLLEEVNPVIVQDFQYLSRLAVNDTINGLFLLGQSEAVYRLYDGYTKDRQITYLLVSAGMLKKIPVNLLFGLVKWESQFDPRAVYRGATSIDSGVMMLNSKSFPLLTESEMFDPATNIEYGTTHFLEKREEFGSWIGAVIAYNRGNLSSMTMTTVNHLINVLLNERDIDTKFVETFGGIRRGGVEILLPYVDE